MNLQKCQELVERVTDDFRATEAEKTLAEGLGRRCRDARRPAEMADAIQKLEQVLAEIERRDHRRPTVAGEERSGRPSLALIQLEQVLIDAEAKWGRTADRQLRIGLVSLPLTLAVVAVLAVTPLWLEAPNAMLLLSLLVAAAATYGFLLLRIHQQARQAEERIVEKRVGLAFLRIAIEDHAGRPELDTLVQAGTQMFLGHHAAPTIPLGPDDLRLALVGTTRSGKS